MSSYDYERGRREGLEDAIKTVHAQAVLNQRRATSSSGDKTHYEFAAKELRAMERRLREMSLS